MRRPVRLALVFLVVAFTGVIVPAAFGAAPVTSAAAVTVPDQWSGEWPAQLMEQAGPTPLGTLVWRAIRYEDGMALLGTRFGGRVFTGCPTDGTTRFFRGRYVQGGSLVACTRGADGSELHGRFDGNETFRSGEFTVRITAHDPSFFFGEYIEDGGRTVDWCGLLERAIVLPEGRVGASDFVAPIVTMRPAKSRVGSRASFHFSVRDASPRVRVDLSVITGGKAVWNLSAPSVKADGSLRTLRWRVPPSLRGKKVRVCGAALDRAGNVGGRTCARLTVT